MKKSVRGVSLEIAPSRRPAAAKAKNGANLGSELKLWQAADDPPVCRFTDHREVILERASSLRQCAGARYCAELMIRESPASVSSRWRLLVSVLLLSFAVPARGRDPVLRALEPRGAPQGRAFTLILKGEGLTPGAEVITSIPGTFSRLAVRPEVAVPESELPFLVQLRQDAPVDLYPIRIRTEEGQSNVMLFTVGKFPEVVEAESLSKESHSNDSLATAQKVTPPITINGSLEGPDRDYYSFSAKAGERLVFEVEAGRAGSAIDPVIQVLDKSGRELATNDDAPGLGVDARVEVVFPKAGDYYVEVYDVKYSSQEQNFYRLTIAPYPYAQGIFPLGWQRDGTVEVTLVGGNLKAPVRVRPNLSVPAFVQFVPVSLPRGASLPFQFLVSDLPEIMEAAEAKSGSSNAACSPGCPLPASTVVNGRISRPGEVDRYRLRVSPGEHWVVQLEAADLGTSQLLAVLSVFDATTRRTLARAEPGGEENEENKGAPVIRKKVDPHLSFTVPEKVTEVIVAVQDILGRGGPDYGYRLLARQQPFDLSLEVLTPFVNIPAGGTAAVEVAVTRRGYKGPIRLTIPDLPEGIVLDGGNIPAEPFPPGGPNPGRLTLRAKPASKPQTFQMSVWGEAVSGETTFRTRADALGMITTVAGTDERPFTASWLSASLPVTVARRLPVSLEVPVHHLRFAQGSGTKIPWKLIAEGRMHAPFEVKMSGAYACGATFLRDLHAMPKPGRPEHPNEGVFEIVSSLATPAVTFDFVLNATIHEEGNVERTVTAPAITVEIAPLYTLRLVSGQVEIKRSGKFELSGVVRREPGFSGAIKVAAEGLPEHATCSDITISPDQTNFRLLCQADAEAKPGEFEFHLASSATVPGKENQDYRGPELKAQLRVLREM